MDGPIKQKKSTKNFLNKLFNSGSKKNTSSVSPQENNNEWVPGSFVSDVSHHNNNNNNSNYSSNNNQNSRSAYSHQHIVISRRSNEELQSSISRSNSVQRRFSFSNVHESGQKRLLAAKRAEYQEKMHAFDDLIQRRRGSTLRLALAPDVTSY